MHGLTLTRFTIDCVRQIQSIPALPPTFVISHTIDEDSPLFGKSEADIIAEEGFIWGSVVCRDAITSQVLFEAYHRTSVLKSRLCVYTHFYESNKI